MEEDNQHKLISTIYLYLFNFVERRGFIIFFGVNVEYRIHGRGGITHSLELISIWHKGGCEWQGIEKMCCVIY